MAGISNDNRARLRHRLAAGASAAVLALWSGRDELARWYDVPAVWRDWADDVRGHAIDSGHYLAEEAPNETVTALRAFFKDGGPSR